MSTEIKTITGRYEVRRYEVPGTGNAFDPEYIKSHIHLTRFYGGKENGSMLQITIQNDKRGSTYVQLTQSQVADLAYTLTHAFNTDKYPSD